MKKSLLFLLITVMCAASSGAPAKYSSSPKTSTYRSAAKSRPQISANNYSEIDYSRIRKREMYALGEIHRMQNIIIRKKKLSPKQSQRFIMELEKRKMELADALKKTPSFPHPESISNVLTVIKKIQTGEVEFCNLSGKDNRTILRKLQQEQSKALSNSYQRRFPRKYRRK